MKTPGLLLSLCMLVHMRAAYAANLTESFDSRANYASGTAIWNQALGVVHPSLRAMDYDIFGTPPALPFDVGDGSNGAFELSTYANFSTSGDISGQIIRLDTDTFQSLQVTSFTLEPGWRIIAEGTRPLIIKSLSTVKIYGEIHCEGTDGGNSSGVTIGAKGIGRCGGRDGGSGGAAAGPGIDGDNADALVTGGAGGIYFGGTAAGGGGGGSWNSIGPQPGPNAGAFNGGQAGASHSDAEFTIVKGGAGGGGGSGDATTAGGGGGGGGGVVIIYSVGAVDIGTSPSSTTGFIYAHGGRGGNASGNGGPGGGGGGGSVQIFSGGDLNFYNTDADGASQATGGKSGTNAALDVGAIGGLGRSWIATPTFFTGGTGHYSPTEEAPATVGRTEFNTASESVVTKVFDRGAVLLPIQSLAISPASGNFTFQVAGSDDGFVVDDTGFTTNVALITNKRYLKMQLTINTTHILDPIRIESVAVVYPTIIQDEFTFKAAGCGRVGGGSRANLLYILIAPLMLIALRLRIRFMR